MKIEEIIGVLDNHKGQIVRAKWRKLLKTRKGILQNIEKITYCSVRFGLDYDSQMRVKMGREIGELAEIPQALPWGNWSKYPYLIEHKNKKYLRAYLAYGTRPITQFFIDGKPADKQEIEPFVLASEIKDGSEPLAMTISVDNLEELKVSKKVFKLK